MDVGLAKVINSTIGTTKFQSLDEIILGSKSVVASDTLYHTFNTTATLAKGDDNPSRELEVVTFKFPYSGSMRLNMDLKTTSGYTQYIRIYKNGNNYITLTEDNSKTMSQDITAMRDDIVKITVQKQEAGSATYTTSLTVKDICATIIEGRSVLMD